MNESRYNRTKETKLPRQKRVKLLHGAGDDHGKYYRCWNCGFTCNADRDAFGGDSNIGYLEYTATADGPTVAENLLNPIDYPDVSSGCPLCGTKNWK